MDGGCYGVAASCGVDRGSAAAAASEVLSSDAPKDEVVVVTLVVVGRARGGMAVEGGAEVVGGWNGGEGEQGWMARLTVLCLLYSAQTIIM